jgi:hypothetical protein
MSLADGSMTALSECRAGAALVAVAYELLSVDINMSPNLAPSSQMTYIQMYRTDIK